MKCKPYALYTGVQPVFVGYRCPPNHATWLEWFVRQDKEEGSISESVEFYYSFACSICMMAACTIVGDMLNISLEKYKAFHLWRL